MKKFTSFIFLLIALFVNTFALYSQEEDNGSLSNEEIEKYKEQITGLVKYLEGTLNFLGDTVSVPKEKEIIINESYLKIFQDDKVQIEDDLDENREVPLHKDVQAYLKDIEFFYKNVKFEFVISDISHFLNENNQHYFKVTFNRILDGITVDNDTVSSKKLRYMEVNLDIVKNDLKIASIYTTKLDEKEEIKNWWNNLTAEWRNIFGENIHINDSILLADIIYFSDSLIVKANDITKPDNDSVMNYSRTIVIELPAERKIHIDTAASYDSVFFDTKIIYTKLNGIVKQQKIDVSGNDQIRNLEPLNELTGLAELNCSNTLISNLVPLRNLNRLEILDCSETPVGDLTPLHYSTTVKDLNCSYTLINDLSSISGLIRLERLNCAGIKINGLDFLKNCSNLKFLDCNETGIFDIKPLEGITTLENLDISGTKVRNLEPLTALDSLTYLNCESSWVVSVEPLKDLSNLEVLRISNTDISSLQPLDDLENLKKIYCDNTEIKEEETIQFMRDHPGCLVIFESEELLTGWKKMDEAWKEIVRNNAVISEPPTKEELHSFLKIKELNISGNEKIDNLSPIRKLFNLKALNISSVKATDFSPVGDAIELEDVNISNTSVKNLEFACNLYNLKEINIENTSVNSLEPLKELKNLKIVYADNSGIGDKVAFQFMRSNPDCLVVYKSDDLQSWWKSLPASWKDFFSGQFKVDSPPTKEQLHRILFLDSLSIINNNQIENLDPLIMLQGLITIQFSGTQVNDLQPLSQLGKLKAVQCTQNPISDLEPLISLSELENLNIENTPVSDLKPLASLQSIKVLNCSGTQIKSLKPLANLIKLEHIELNNTAIKSLKPLLDLHRLKTVKCYNTKMSVKNVDKFKAAKPHCEVVYY